MTEHAHDFVARTLSQPEGRMGGPFTLRFAL
jgi:hypothetical protein